MIIQGQRVLYDNKLQPAQIFLHDDGTIANINLSYDPRLRLTTDEVFIAFAVVFRNVGIKSQSDRREFNQN